jgi:hypothetical protein
MKWMSALVVGLYASVSLGSCNVYVPVKEFNYAGLVISFDFYALFDGKGYKEVGHIGEADYELKLTDEEVLGRYFHKAKASYEFINLRNSKTVLAITHDKTCLTQYCGISDYRSVWVKGYKKILKTFPTCK